MNTEPSRAAAGDADGPQVMRCIDCASPVELIQPDPGMPDRLLAACCACKAWYVLCDASARRVAEPEAGRRRRPRRPGRTPAAV